MLIVIKIRNQSTVFKLDELIIKEFEKNISHVVKDLTNSSATSN